MSRSRFDWESYEPPARDLNDKEPTFICAWCREEVDDYEATTMARLPEMPIVCINCACGTFP